MTYEKMIEQYRAANNQAEACFNMAANKSKEDADHWNYMAMYCQHKAVAVSAKKAADYLYQVNAE